MMESVRHHLMEAGNAHNYSSQSYTYIKQYLRNGRFLDQQEGESHHRINRVHLQLWNSIIMFWLRDQERDLVNIAAAHQTATFIGGNPRTIRI